MPRSAFKFNVVKTDIHKLCCKSKYIELLWSISESLSVPVYILNIYTKSLYILNHTSLCMCVLYMITKVGKISLDPLIHSLTIRSFFFVASFEGIIDFRGMIYLRNNNAF